MGWKREREHKKGRNDDLCEGTKYSQRQKMQQVNRLKKEQEVIKKKRQMNES